MARPTSAPTWTTSNPTDPTTGQPARSEPDSGKKAVGFTFNEKPARQFLNWLLWALGDWVTYFAELIDQSVVAGASPRFAKITNTSHLDLEANGGASAIRAKGRFYVLNTSGVAVADVDIDGKATFTDVVPGKVNGSSTGITGTELETLSAAGNADALHKHTVLTDGALVVTAGQIVRQAYAAMYRSGSYLSVTFPGSWLIIGGTHNLFTHSNNAGGPTVDVAGCAITITEDGMYQISANVDTSDYATIAGEIGVFKGSGVTTNDTIIKGPIGYGISCARYLTAGAYYLKGYAVGAPSGNTGNANFSIVRVSA